MSLNQGGPDAKKPCKGILKTSSSFDKHSSHRKSAKFDELNVLQTYHPPDKDYGHMKIEEPKTPYRPNDHEDGADQLDAELLAEKLKSVTSNTRDLSDSDDEEEEEETEEQRQKRLEFEKRRKAHYNEFEAVRQARKLIEEEDDDDDANDGNEARDDHMDVDVNAKQSTSASASASARQKHHFR